ncbi:MAG: hypothetical protein LUQ12_05160, partial [Methanoregulaceae archaeon]|nr:hypothetical protein [Methanoregulaceae archaeon]
GHGGVIDAYGWLQPCMFVRDPGLVVNLKTVPLKDAIPAIESRIRGLRSTSPEYLKRCARCFLHGLCDQCPGKSWSEHGTLDTPVEYLCQVAHEKGRCLGLLNEGERAWEVTDWKPRVDRLKSQKTEESP